MRRFFFGSQNATAISSSIAIFLLMGLGLPLYVDKLFADGGETAWTIYWSIGLPVAVYGLIKEYRKPHQASIRSAW